MKISIIGGGNVGGLTALRLAQEKIGDIMLIDIVAGLAEAKAYDLDDSRWLLGSHYSITGSADFKDLKGSNIVVITAGLPRKPGMTREDLLNKNAGILKDVCAQVQMHCPDAIVIIVTNPLDIMTTYALKITGFDPAKLFGMGISLDSSRFANLISQAVHASVEDIEAYVIGIHGEGMMALPRLSKVKGRALSEILDVKTTDELARRTVERGKQIVTLLGSGSAYFAPSAAIAQIVTAIAKDQKRTIGVCAYLNGQYGVKDICIGVPAIIGANGVERIIELDLNTQEKQTFVQACETTRTNLCTILS